MSGLRSGMILAAGLGTRLRPRTDHRPKALIEVGRRPMIEYPLRMLAAAGVRNVVINLHHEGEQIRAALGDGSRFGVEIAYSPEDPILDTGGAIARARPLLGDGSFALVNCDALLDVPLTEVFEGHARRRAISTLVLRADPRAERYGAIDIGADGKILRFLGKPKTVPGPLERRMFCGVHVLSPDIFDYMPEEGVFSITRDTYRRAHETGAALYGHDYSGYWRDLGTPSSLEEADQDLASGRFAPSYLP